MLTRGLYTPEREPQVVKHIAVLAAAQSPAFTVVSMPFSSCRIAKYVERLVSGYLASDQR